MATCKLMYPRYNATILKKIVSSSFQRPMNFPSRTRKLTIKHNCSKLCMGILIIRMKIDPKIPSNYLSYRKKATKLQQKPMI